MFFEILLLAPRFPPDRSSEDVASYDIIDMLKANDSKAWKCLPLVHPNFRHAMLLDREKIA
jgi:hypothetical protein